MREILFRGKAINRHKGYHRTSYKNGDWVYGLITRLYDERFENLPAEMSDFGVNGIEVDYKTIEQYTGLTDKNGKRIFEGDIVKAPIYYDVGCYPHTDTKIIVVKIPDIYKMRIDGSFEIIGNIHDNLELLEGENDKL